MIEPKTPVVLKIRYSPYPAVILASDENLPLKPKSVILRHRHLRQQQTVVQSSLGKGAGSSRPLRGVVIGAVVPSGEHSAAPGPSSFRHVDAGNLRAPLPASSEPAFTDDPPAQGSHLPPSPIVAHLSLAVPHSDAPQAVIEPRSNPRAGPEVIKHPALVSASSMGKLVLMRGSHAIRSTTYKTTWWMTKARDYLATPITVPTVQVGDLYVHLASDGRQAWLRTPSQEWVTVEERHAHPLLRDYLLRFLENGEPRWVTKESFRTYTGREKKARREAISSSTDSM